MHHPRFGELKCIRTTRAVKAGEELCVTYGYDLNDPVDSVPDWFRAEARKFGVSK
jgi:histone-lysine N-methyltransferase SETD7